MHSRNVILTNVHRKTGSEFFNPLLWKLQRSSRNSDLSRSGRKLLLAHDRIPLLFTRRVTPPLSWLRFEK